MKFLGTILIIAIILFITINIKSQSIEAIWVERTPVISPEARFHHAMTYDIPHDKIILFGGNVDGNIEDITWAYDLETNIWENRNAANSPPGVNYHALAYDVKNDKTIMFGGFEGNPTTLTGNTYAYDYDTNSWEHMNPPNSPAKRRSHQMVYDPIKERVILFGGIALIPGSGIVNSDETWSYSYEENNWGKLDPSTTPTPRATTAMTYDNI